VGRGTLMVLKGVLSEILMIANNLSVVVNAV
jgi:hypothetical protein